MQFLLAMEGETRGTLYGVGGTLGLVVMILGIVQAYLKVKEHRADSEGKVAETEASAKLVAADADAAERKSDAAVQQHQVVANTTLLADMQLQIRASDERRDRREAELREEVGELRGRINGQDRELFVLRQRYHSLSKYYYRAVAQVDLLKSQVALLRALLSAAWKSSGVSEEEIIARLPPIVEISPAPVEDIDESVVMTKSG